MVMDFTISVPEKLVNESFVGFLEIIRVFWKNQLTFGILVVY